MPEQEMGLAAQQMGAQSGAPAAGSGQPITVEELAALLSQGITPEELQAAGVPVELIKQAIAMLNQSQAPAAPTQGAMGQGGTPMGDDGLASQAAMMGSM